MELELALPLLVSHIRLACTVFCGALFRVQGHGGDGQVGRDVERVLRRPEGGMYGFPRALLKTTERG